MKKGYRLLALLLLWGLILSFGAFASSEEPSEEPSGEMSLTLTVSPEEGNALVLDIPVTVNGNVYTFNLEGLLSALGVTMTYDPQTRRVILDRMPTLPALD